MTVKRKPGLTDPVWIRKGPLQQRWGMPHSTFHWRLKKGLIPAPEYPFGPDTPYWRLSVIEEFEKAPAQAAATAA